MTPSQQRALARWPLRGDAAQAARWYDVMPCYLSVQDRDLRIIETNGLLRRDFQASPGDHCYRVYKRRSSPCPDCPVERSFVTGSNHTAKERVVNRHGELTDVIVTSTPLFDDQGRIEAVVEMFTDVTEIRTLNSKLRRSRHHFRRLFDIVPCYISVQDRDLRIVESNALFRQDFGERAGERCHEVYKGGEAVCQSCPVVRSFADGQVHSSEETVITRDGQQASVVVTSMPIPDEHGEINAVMEVSTNVTEVKRLQSLATVGLAVTGMAHRIKNILMGLEGGVYVVDTGFELDEPETVQEGWGMVQRNVEKVSQVAKDLLFCSKDRRPALQKGVSVEKIVREVHDLYRHRIAAEGIELRLESDDALQPGVFDPEALHNLVSNLMANAVDACRFDPDLEQKRHVIHLRTLRGDSDAVVIEVADNGAGIPDEIAHKVLEGFFSTKGTEGTGLGLLVVQRVVEEHGGEFSFETRLGQGSCFKAILPRGPASSHGDRPINGGEK